MPKQVDHEARRAELLAALWRITAADGWDAISLRGVATEAGVSLGTVQHYFTSKDEMLRFAIQMMAEDTRLRIRRRIAGLPPTHSPRLLTETILVEMIPDTDRRASEAEAAGVWIRRFLLRPDSRAALAAAGAELAAGLAEQIRLGRGGPRQEAERDAAGLIALVDGLILNYVAGNQTTESAIEILRAALDRLFGD